MSISLDSSRTRSSGGSGLGLSIVRAIIKAHGTTITLTPRVTQLGGQAVFLGVVMLVTQPKFWLNSVIEGVPNLVVAPTT
ncbi:ATP-binding protein [Kribbella sp. NPDC051587]|uniref:ATP-binding protein n=1 Tax=Kribbella sp. NPDC051587 TaxID=3364119 RepID=UPI0037AAC0CC